MSALGVIYVGLPAIALDLAANADAYGMLAVLFVFVVVWTTDTFAYVCGRLDRRPQAVAIAVAAQDLGRHRRRRVRRCGGRRIRSSGAAAGRDGPDRRGRCRDSSSAAAQVGDLAESALKRAYNVESASQPFRGHGGFMDRMDGIVAAACVAALLAGSRSVLSPGYGLLFWS